MGGIKNLWLNSADMRMIHICIRNVVRKGQNTTNNVTIFNCWTLSDSRSWCMGKNREDYTIFYFLQNEVKQQ